MKRSVLLWALLFLPASLPASDLILDLRTNYEPGTEFRMVRVLLVDRADERRSWHALRPVFTGDFLRGERIAEFGDVSRGTYLVSVELLDARMRPVDGRIWILSKGDVSLASTALVARR